MSAVRDPSLRARILSVTPLRFVRAGSSLVTVRGRLLVVQDDALAVAWVDPATLAIEHATLQGFGGPLAKTDKPDFEAAFVDRDGAVVILGSGSTEARCRAARLDPATGDAKLEDWTPLYEALTARLGVRPNVEGAVRVGGTLRLLHRGAGAGKSAVVDVAIEDAGQRADPPLAVAWHDLGAIEGVPLSFTDAEAVEGGIVYLAAAEDTPNAVDDGRIAGAAFGVITEDGARYAVLEEADGTPSRRKVEGLALAPGGGEAFVVTDPDDATQPAELCRVELVGFPVR